MAETTHSPLPWEAVPSVDDEWFDVIDYNGETVVALIEECEAVAIVHFANSHTKMVNALKSIWSARGCDVNALKSIAREALREAGEDVT